MDHHVNTWDHVSHREGASAELQVVRYLFPSLCDTDKRLQSQTSLTNSLGTWVL